MRLSHRGLRLHAKVIPAAFPSGKTGHIFGAVNANLEWTRISVRTQDRPDRGSGDHRTLNPAINPIMLQGTHP